MHYQMTIHQVAFDVFLGVFQEERASLQRIYLDIDLMLDQQSALRSDRVEETLNYPLLIAHLEQMVQKQPFCLLETLGQYLHDAIVAYCPSRGVRIVLTKNGEWMPESVEKFRVELASGCFEGQVCK